MSATNPIQPTTPRRVLSEQLQSTWETPAVYLPSYQFVDGFGRERENQAPSQSGSGRMVTVTTYNDRGLPARQSPPQYNSAAAGSGLLNPAIADLTSYTVTDYDDRERAWRARHYTGGATTPDRTTLTVDKGNRVETTPARGERTISYYDTFGRTTQIKKYSSPTAFATTSYAYSYSADGSRVDVTDPHTTITSFFSDLAGRRTKLIDPNAGTSEYWYDNNGNTIQTRDPAGTVNTEYDVLDRPTVRRSTPPGGDSASQYESARWAYDPPNAKGHLSYSDSTTRTTIDGNTQDFTIRKSVPAYDGRYRPTSSNTTLPTSTALGALSGVSYYEEYVYDAADHLTRIVYPAIGDLPAERADTGFTNLGTASTYTLTPDGGTAMPVVTGVSWTGSGQLDKRTMASGAIRDIDWDESWRAPQYVGTYWQPEDQEWPFFWQLDEYTRDQVGNVTSITDHALWPTQSQCFSYDAWNQLTDAYTIDPNATDCTASFNEDNPAWNTGPDPYRARWAYSANGDITTASIADITTTGGTETVTWTDHVYTRGDANHQSAVTGITPSVRGFGNDAFSYDGAGRMTTRLTNGINHNLGWNPTHQLTSTKKVNGSTVTPHRYAYDASGGRVLKIGTDEVTAYFGDTQVTARLIAPDAGTMTGIRHYSQDGASVAKRNGNQPIRYLFDDIQGSATLAVDAGNPATAQTHRQRYTPYGATRGPSEQLNIERGWLGQIEDDATGLTYLNARYYDPAVARFISPDPVVRPGDPQTLNPYTYGDNNPLTLSDPGGLEPGSSCNSSSQTGCGEKQLLPGANGGNAQAARQSLPADVREAQDALADAQQRHDDAKRQVISSAKALGKILADELGITAGVDCFTKGDFGACAETLGNALLSALGGGVLGKLGAKYAAPWKWKAGKALIDRIWSLGKDLVGGIKKFFQSADELGDAQRRLDTVVASSCPVGNSFDGDTPVLMADGSKKPIRDVKIGDKVLATDPKTGQTRPEPVTNVIVGNGKKHLVQVTVKTTAGTGTVLATDHHPFWNATTNTWTDAEDLQPGTNLRDHHARTTTITTTRQFDRTQTVHDLTINNLHTYYVMAGNSSVLVHNCGGGLGGRYSDLKPAGGGMEIHHMPADSVSPLSRGDGPAIRMEVTDHRKTASWGSGRAARDHRAQQKELIDQGRMDDAIQMDIDDIQSKFGDKYDEHILQMIDGL